LTRKPQAGDEGQGATAQHKTTLPPRRMFALFTIISEFPAMSSLAQGNAEPSPGDAFHAQQWRISLFFGHCRSLFRVLAFAPSSVEQASPGSAVLCGQPSAGNRRPMAF
jgi:hypothetical protein